MLRRASTKKVELPAHFAENVLRLELDLESNSNIMDTLRELLELYTVAVEYYSTQRDPKYK